MPHVFISYASENLEIAERVCAVLEREGLACWLAVRNIEPAASWPASIVTAIGNSWLMICIVSQDAYRSRQVARELECADSTNVAILPVRIDAAPLQGEFQFFLGNRQWLDLSRGAPEDHEAPLVQTVRALERERPRPPVAPDVTGVPPPAAEETASILPARPIRGRVDRVRGEFARVVDVFMAVVTKREKALDGLALSDSRTLFFALRFLLYMTVVSLLVHVPAWSQQGISLSRPSHLLSFLTDDLIEKLALCILLDVVLRSVGGKADLRQSVAAFCFLCAFQPLVAVSLIPSHLLTGSLLRQTSNGFEFLEQASALSAQSTLWDLTVLAVSFTLSTLVWVVFMVALFNALRTLHRLGRMRAAAAFALGIVAWIVIDFVLLYPFEASMYKSFGAA